MTKRHANPHCVLRIYYMSTLPSFDLATSSTLHVLFSHVRGLVQCDLCCLLCGRRHVSLERSEAPSQDPAATAVNGVPKLVRRLGPNLIVTVSFQQCDLI